MKCPHCDYQHGWDGESLKDIKGSEGEFFELSNDIKMERKENGWRYKVKHILGCPKCNKLFMAH